MDAAITHSKQKIQRDENVNFIRVVMWNVKLVQEMWNLMFVNKKSFVIFIYTFPFLCVKNHSHFSHPLNKPYLYCTIILLYKTHSVQNYLQDIITEQKLFEMCNIDIRNLNKIHVQIE